MHAIGTPFSRLATVGSVGSLVHDSIPRLIRMRLKHPTVPKTARSLRSISRAIRDGHFHTAMREVDRAWRCLPAEAATLATIYGRLLVLEAIDHNAALHLLRRAVDLTSHPEDNALVAWALSMTGRDQEARKHLAAALSNYSVKPGDLLHQVAGRILQQASGVVAGWVGRGPDLCILGELASNDHPVVVGPDTQGAVSTTLRPVSVDGRWLFEVACPPAALGDKWDASAVGIPLLASGARHPKNFGLDGRLEFRGQRLGGWARLGWAPDSRLRIAVEDERGQRGYTETRSELLYGGGRAFELDLGRHGPYGSRLTVSAQLPDGRWCFLPDSPLLRDVVPGRPLGKWTHLRVKAVPTSSSLQRPDKRPIARAPRADVIIPVYRDRAATLACIQAVLHVVDAETPVVVVDDATDDPELAEALDALASKGRITLLRNPENMGFVVSVNRAMALHPEHDAVLLNADTLVHGDWLSRLREAAYCDPDVGTATPLSNSGSIVSYPRKEGSEIDRGQASALDILAAATHAQVRVPIPVGVGFCLYIRRDCLSDVGPFDAGNFDKGYGEEAEFCVRAHHRGWSHRLAADVFVFHAGGSSFGERRNALLDRSQRLLNVLHPGYDRWISDFLAQDPLHRIRRKLDEQRLREFDGQFVLLVTLALSGGVDRFVAERCRDLKSQGFFPLLLKPTAAETLEQCELRTDALAVPNLQFGIPCDLEELTALLRSLPIASIEIQHFLHLDSRLIDAVRELPLPYDIVVHDYAWICPRITLIDGEGTYCGEPPVNVCESCVSVHGSHLGEVLSVAALRTRSHRWLHGARRVTAPTMDTAGRLQRHFPGLRVDVRPNALTPVPAVQTPASRRRRSADELVRVALIGAIGGHKGYQILLECAKHARAARLPIEFVVIGYTESDAPLLATGKVFVTGRYTEGEVLHLLRREQPDVLWLPSVWPETWCYALDHALQSGLPVAAFDIGAIAERLRAAGRGELMPMNLDSKEIIQRLLRLAAHSDLPGATASRSQQISVVPRSKGVSMGLTTSHENSMTTTAERPAAAPRPDEGLSASVQVLDLNAGLFLFSVKSANSSAAMVSGRLRLPAMHVGLGPGIPPERVEFMSGHATQGGWLFAATDQLVVKITEPGAALIVTSVRSPAGDALSIKVESLSARSELPRPAVSRSAPSQALDGSLAVQISTHIRSRGDMTFADAPWAGRVAPGLWIESFSVKPLDGLRATDIEYKGLTGSGFETPWLTDDKSCGTQGLGVPLVGFALRLRASPMADEYSCEYFGYFQSGATVGPLSRGAPCRSRVANDPLEGIQVRLVKRASANVVAAAKGAVAASGGIQQDLPDKGLPATARRGGRVKALQRSR